MPGPKKVAVVLSGCGHQDGAEITEAVSTLIALSEQGAEYAIFAPDQSFTVTDALSSLPTAEMRNVLRESARVARGHIRPLDELSAEAFDAIAFPGGFGVALHLCTWAHQGAKCSVLPQVARVIDEFYMAEKPILAICIAPALIAKVLGSEGLTLTLGRDPEAAAELSKTGAQHENCAVDDFVTDRQHRVVSTPAYMYGTAKPHEVFHGISKAVAELVGMA